MVRSITAAALALVAASGLLPLPRAAAQPPERPEVTHVETVRDLAAVCDPRWGGVPRLEAIAYCQGFLTSAGQYHALLHPQGSPMQPLFCVPRPGPSIAEAGLGFAAWARANPSHANEPALDGMLRWAQVTYPCPPAGAPHPRRHSR